MRRRERKPPGCRVSFPGGAIPGDRVRVVMANGEGFHGSYLGLMPKLTLCRRRYVRKVYAVVLCDDGKARKFMRRTTRVIREGGGPP